ncbi:hypothetical protein Xsto_01313 [Xenorhabdus stockiae]|uniref:Uncharacterized protein n=1 Tax=Xenorhabdus stockiae TaxID=351614 RepID=A0A2D0KSJ3_9GAMM|nr:hypothetical protein [Xenorhabdus stockiae]PHM66381.1 hypothetical protein Xsto_01313 [Xenorhabdus stockiae]
MKNVIKKWFYNKFNKIRVRDLPAVCLSELNISQPVEKSDTLDQENIRWTSFLESINDKKCQIRHAMNVARLLVLLPVTLGLMLGLCFFINDFLKAWSANAKTLLKFVEYSKEKYGEKFFLNPKAPEYTNLLKIIADDKEISFLKYLYIRYSKNSLYREDRSKHKLITDGGFLFFL